MKSNSRFMTSSEKKLKKKNGIIRLLAILLLLSLFINVALVKYIANGDKNDGSVTDGIINKVISSDRDKVVSDNNSIEDDELNDNDNSDGTGTLGNFVSAKSEIYDVLYKQILSKKESLEIAFAQESISYEDVYEVYNQILYDHPEFFWLSGGANTTGTTINNFTTLKVELNTTCDMSQVDNMEDDLNLVISKIVIDAEQCDSDYDKVKSVHDSIIELCDYDIDAFNRSLANGYNEDDAIVYTAYGCLVNKKSVCGGYAKAFQLAMNKLGIECGYITGIGVNSLASGPHAWNYVKVDEKYYYVDVTWDDPVYDEGASKPDEICTDYFCISLEEISKDHYADEGQYLPQ